VAGKISAAKNGGGVSVLSAVAKRASTLEEFFNIPSQITLAQGYVINFSGDERASLSKLLRKGVDLLRAEDSMSDEDIVAALNSPDLTYKSRLSSKILWKDDGLLGVWKQLDAVAAQKLAAKTEDEKLKAVIDQLKKVVYLSH